MREQDLTFDDSADSAIDMRRSRWGRWGLEIQRVFDDALYKDGHVRWKRIVACIVMVGILVGTTTCSVVGRLEKVPAARAIFAVMVANDRAAFDRLDVVCTTYHITLTNYPELVRRVLERGGRVRIAVLSEQISDRPALLAKLAKKFGQSADELEKEVRGSHAAIRRFRDSLPEAQRSRFEVRAYLGADEKSEEGYLVPFRSYHFSSSKNRDRLDVLVPYRVADDGRDTPLRESVISFDGAASSEVVKATSAFDRVFEEAEELR